jgi:hypothetical protein
MTAVESSGQPARSSRSLRDLLQSFLYLGRFGFGCSITLSIGALCWSLSTLAAPPLHESIAIPGGEPGVGYDDLQYAPRMRRILAPAGRTGMLALIDPATKRVDAIAGFSAKASYHGGHGEGTTSSAELDQSGFVVATDREARGLRVVDIKRHIVGDPIKLEGSPDYVRLVRPTREVWVTEPGRKQIEILHIDESAPPRLSHAANIAVPDGPESLVIDDVRGRAYSHSWSSESYAIDLRARRVVSTWRNGCHDSRGIALDQRRGMLLAGCAEGKATVVDLAKGRLVSSAPTGPGVDSIGYSASLGHLYVPAGGSAELWIFGLAADASLALLGKVSTSSDAHTVAFDPDSSTIFIGTPNHGVVLAIPDTWRAR